MSLLELRPRLSIFEGLKSYSRTDVELINLFEDLFRGDARWGLWIQEGLGALLEVAGERMVLLQQTNQIEPGDSRNLSFQKDEILIGRERDSDVVIPIPGVGRRHARIIKKGAQFFVEDLGSANGTYLNDARLAAHQPALLNEGARLLVFPFQFTFSNQQVWSQEQPLRLATGAARAVTWSESGLTEFAGMSLFNLKISPDIGTAALGISQDFLKALVQGISHAEIRHVVFADAGLFEFLLLSVLERANRELKFPFRFSLGEFEAPRSQEHGIAMECVIGLTGARGLIQLFLPASLLKEVSRWPVTQPPQISVSWPLMTSAGYCDLSLEEIANVEAGDILLATSAHSLLLPSTAQSGERGWRAVLVKSNPRRLRIEDYFERSDFAMESQAAAPEQSDLQKPNLAALPVRVHIVLSQLEMTLAELNKLRPGSIVELDRDESESVQLAVNGKIAGAGELVEIEGRLGVRISNWTAQ